VDTNKEHLAVNEARKLNIPVVAILDTNCDPDVVDYKIPGNDDAIRSIATLTRVVADAVAEGLMARAGQQANADKPSYDEAPSGQLATDEPLPAWEQELLAGSGEAPAAPADAPAADAPAAEAPAADAPAAEADATTES
jgi:small subunit ribosomal protein S2